MHLVLHIGQPKTGTSALQDALFRNREVLLELGVFYPKAARGKGHHPLVVRFFPENMWPRLVRHDERVRPGSVFDEANHLLEAISREIDHGQVHTVVLSAEYLFRPLTEQGKAKVKNWIEERFDSSEIVCYVRRPSDQYLSNSLQALRHSSAILPPRGLHVRPSIEAWSEIAEVSVCKYERDALAGGNIAEDFITRFLPQVNFSSLARPHEDRNVAFSAEAASILQSYRKRFHPDSDDIVVEDANMLAQRLDDLCKTEPWKRRACLRNDIKEFIDHGSEQLVWLDERFGVRFDDLDYTQIGRSPLPVPKAEAVEDICVVDAGSRDDLLMKLLRDGVRFPVSQGSVQKERDALLTRVKAMESRIEKILSSSSWRFTAPLRTMGRWLRTLFAGRNLLR